MQRSARVLLIIVILAVVAGAVGIDLVVNRLLLERLQSEQRATVQAQTGSVRAHIEELINSDLRIVEATASYVAIKPDLSENEFVAFAERVARDARALRSLAAAPDLRIEYVYPREGNESIVGLSYFELPNQLPEVLRARDERELVVAGPTRIVQGGLDVLARAPVYTEDENGSRFWGLVSSRISFEQLTGSAEQLAEQFGLSIALRGTDGRGAEGSVFFGPEALFADSRSVVRDIVIPNGSWQIAVEPRNGWHERHPAAPLIHAGTALLVLFLAGTVYSRVRQGERVRASEERLRHITLGSSDVVWETDQTGTITYALGRSPETLGSEPDKLVGRCLFELSSERSKATVKSAFDKALGTGGTIEDLEIWIDNDRGERRCFARTAVPIFSPNGTVLGFRGVDKDVTARKELQQELEYNARMLDLFFQQSLDGFFFMMLDEPIRWNASHDKDALLEWVLDHQRVTKVNQAMLDQYRAAEQDFLGRTPRDFFPHEPDAGRNVWRRFLQSGHVHVDTEERRLDGTAMAVEGDYITITDKEHRTTGLFGIQRDVTEQRDAAAELERYIDIVDRHVLTSQTDLGGTITYASEAFSRISGYAKNELIGSNHRIIRHPDTPDSVFRDMWDTITSGKTWHGELKNRRRDGSAYWVDADVSPLLDRRGNHYGYMSVRLDITAQKELEIASVTDALTGLYNRQRLDEELELQRARHERYDAHVSVVLLDIDHFKSINDNQGHQVGDRVLREIASKLRTSVRDADVVGRWGGEEFLIVLPHTDQEGAVRVAEHTRVVIERNEFDVAGAITASFGVAELNDAGVDDVIRRADDALYEAKRTGRNRVVSADRAAAE